MAENEPLVAEFTAQQIDTALQAGTVLGSGSHGTVHRARLSGLEVAIKILHTAGPDTGSTIPGPSGGANPTFSNPTVIDFPAYVAKLADMNHEALLPLMGCCYERKALVYPVMDGGSLIDRLKPGHKAGTLSWQDRVRILYDVTDALVWLQQHNLKHGNLKPSNILVDSYDAAQVADVGLPMKHEEGHSTTNPSDDVYSLGTIMQLMLTGKISSDSISSDHKAMPLDLNWIVGSEAAHYLEDHVILNSLRSDLDPSAGWPDDQAAAVAKLAAACRHADPDQRPSLESKVFPAIAALYEAIEGDLTSDDLSDQTPDAAAAVEPGVAAAAAAEDGSDVARQKDQAKPSAAAILRSKTWSKPPTGLPNRMLTTASTAAADSSNLQRLYTQQRLYSFPKQYSLSKQYSFQRQPGAASFYKHYSVQYQPAGEQTGKVATLVRQFTRQMTVRSGSARWPSSTAAAAAGGSRLPQMLGTTTMSSSKASDGATSIATAASAALSVSSSSSSQITSEIRTLDNELFSSDPETQARAMCDLSNRAAESQTFGQSMAANMLQKLATSDDEDVLMVAAAVVADLAQMGLVRSAALSAAAPGVFSKLSKMLSSSDSRVQYAATGALGVLAAISPDHRCEIIAASNVLDQIIALLDQGDEGIQELAALAVGNLVRNMPDQQSRVAAVPGVIPQLTWLLHSSNEGLQETAALALGSLAIGNRTTQAAVAAVAGIYSQLALLLSSSNEAVQQQAAFALGAIADGNPENQAAAAAAAPEILTQLTALLSSSSSSAEMQDAAACALGQIISNNAANQAALVAAVPEIFSMIVSLLSSSSGSSGETTCGSSTSSEDLQLRILMLLGILAESSPTNQSAIAAVSDVFSCLTASLNHSNTHIQQHAAFAIAILACGNPGNQAAFAAVPGAFGQVVGMLSSSVGSVQQSAACAIWSLASDNPANQADISDIPGVFEKLVSLLSSSVEDVQAHAVRALYELAGNSPANQAAAAAVPGVFDQLTAVLASSNDVVRMLSALALWSLATGNPENKTVIIAVPGLFERILTLLSSSNAAAQDAGAGLLQCLSQSTELFQDAITTVPDVVTRSFQLLDSSNPEVQSTATGLQLVLAHASPARAAAVAATPGIWSKVVALLYSKDEKVQVLAAQLLTLLAEADAENAAAASKLPSYSALMDRLGALMDSSNPALQEAAAGALEILAARESVSNKVDNNKKMVGGGLAGQVERLGSVLRGSSKGSRKKKDSKSKKGVGGVFGQMRGAFKSMKMQL